MAAIHHNQFRGNRVRDYFLWPQQTHLAGWIQAEGDETGTEVSGSTDHMGCEMDDGGFGSGGRAKAVQLGVVAREDAGTGGVPCFGAGNHLV